MDAQRNFARDTFVDTFVEYVKTQHPSETKSELAERARTDMGKPHIGHSPGKKASQQW